MTKLAQIVDSKVVAFWDDEDELPDSSHFVSVESNPEVKIGWTYQNGTFAKE
jgi:hypothetical protein